MRNTETIFVWPDTHVPIHHPRAVSTVLQFVADLKPDSVLMLGDFYDCKAPARWSRGTKDEYEPTLHREFVEGKAILENLRTVFDGPVNFIEGNHEARIRNYLATAAPAFSSLNALTLESLSDFDEYEITLRPQPYRFAPGWVAIHGDKLATYAGGSALKMVKTLGLSVVQGHSHRLGVIHETTDKRRTAFEAGHLCDVNQASYLTYPGIANWQMGAGVLYVDQARVHVEALSLEVNGSLTHNPLGFVELGK